jgi:hypothetical protein
MCVAALARKRNFSIFDSTAGWWSEQRQPSNSGASTQRDCTSADHLERIYRHSQRTIYLLVQFKLTKHRAPSSISIPTRRLYSKLESTSPFSTLPKSIR